MDLLRRVHEIIAAQRADRPVLTIAEFFDGNTDEGGSIGCNLTPTIPLATFRKTFETIAARSDVDAVWVVIADDNEGTEWPFSDEILIATAAQADWVAEWCTDISPTKWAALPGLYHPGAERSGQVPNGLVSGGIDPQAPSAFDTSDRASSWILRR